MIVRIVRMEFKPEAVQDFLQVFESSKSLIRAFPGVQKLQLHRDATQENVYYTYSEWRGADDLEAYRKSALFQTVWSQTKIHFSAGPQAFSLLKQMDVDL